MPRSLRAPLPVWFLAVLTTILWSRVVLAYPGGVNTGDVGLGGIGTNVGCNNCHVGGTGSAPSSPTVSVNGAAGVSLVGTPNLDVPVNSSNTLDVTFHNANFTSSFTRAGGFLVYHTNNNGIPNSFGTLGAAAGSHACAAGAMCPDAASLSGSTEVTHSAPYPIDGSANVTVHFTFTTPPGATVCGKYGFRIWLNAVNGDGGCSDPDRATSFDFTITTTCGADANQCHQSGVCSVSAVGSTGTCGPNKGNGTSCNLDANLCTPDTCQAGTCTAAAAITCPATTCQTAGTCAPGTGICSAATSKPNGTTCNADGNVCTTDSCQGGVCSFTGSTVTCSTDQCHTIGACSALTGCPAPVAKGNGTGCDLDGNLCTQDTCQAGTCSAGATVSCTTDQCHTIGACIPGTGLCPAPAAKGNGTGCDLDGNLCTQDTCQGGTCSAGASVVCPSDQCNTAGTCVPGTGVCSAMVPKGNGTSCDQDANVCTQDTCQGGVCSLGPTLSCTTDQCHTIGSCVAATGCPAAVAKGNGTSCDLDANLCTQDTCQTGSCTAGASVVCAADQCHTPGTCAAGTGVCSAPVAKGNGASCDRDGNLCTQDTCQGGACSAGATVTCPSDQCNTAGTCNPASGVCSALVPKLAGTSCNVDANLCTADTCQAGACIVGPAVTCSTDQCHTIGACVAASGCPAAIAKGDGVACNLDANLCTLDTCQLGTCSAGSTVTCSAIDQCHVAGACAPATGVCSNPNRSDGSTCGTASCTGTFTLQPAGSCSSGTCQIPGPVTCPGPCSGALCTGGCTQDSDCSAGNFCNFSGNCVPQLGSGGSCNLNTHCKQVGCRECATAGDNCVDGVCCDTPCGNGDTNDCIACNVASHVGTCFSVPNTTSCSDGNACTQSDACNGGACVAGAPVVCPPPDSCHTAGACNTGSGACSNPAKPDGSTCVAASCPGPFTLQPASSCSSGTCQTPATVTCAGPCSAGACTTACISDSGCSPSYFCNAAGVCAPQLSSGGSCNLAAHCKVAGCRECSTAGDYCIDGVCCDTPCGNGSATDCIACNVPSHVGACFSVPNASSCSDGNACTQNDACSSGTCVSGAPVVCPAPDACHDPGTCNTGSGACSNPSKPDATSCSSAICTGVFTLQPGGSCASGTCQLPSVVTCAGVCSTGACTSGCSSDADCSTGNFCSSTGLCTPELGSAGSCDPAADCKVNGCRECATAGGCVDGRCCDMACGGGDTNDCVACNVPGNEGHCASRGDGSTCSDQNGCTLGDTCASGACIAGPSVVCPLADECHDPGSCNPGTGVCSNPAKADMTPCSSDGHDCTGDSCVSGLCSHPQFSAITCQAAICQSSISLLQASQCAAQYGPDCPPQIVKDCSPGKCSAGACVLDCTVDNDCAPTAYCNGGTCTTKIAKGSTCTGAAGNSCETGNCVDGVCCDTTCTGQCQACDVAGHSGQCTTVTSGPPHASREACKSDSSLCGGSCNGSSASGCGYPDIATICRAGTCDTTSNTATLEAGCDGAGACPVLQVQDCGRFVCGATTCAGDCAPPNGVCSPGNYCSGGVCTPKVENGKGCGNGAQCQSTYCVDTVCCDSDCRGQCQACDVQGSVGTCSTVSDSTPPHGGRFRCDGTGPCKGVCDGTKPDGCTFPDGSKLCSPPDCTSEVATDPGVCSGSGTCSPPTTKSCFPFACGITSCRTACAEPTDCVRGYDCIGQQCTPPGQNMPGADAALEVSTDSATMAPVTVEAAVADSPAAASDAGVDAEASVDADVEVPPVAGDEGGCGCRTVSTRSVSVPWALALLGAMVASSRRGRRRRSSRLS